MVTEQMKPNALVFFRLLFQLILVKLTEKNEEQALTVFKRIATVLELESLREQIIYFFQGMKEKIRRDRTKMKETVAMLGQEGSEGEDNDISAQKQKIAEKDKENKMMMARMRLVKKLFKEHAADPFDIGF